MNLLVANISSQLAQTEFTRVVAAIARQVAEHFAPEWGKNAKLTTSQLSVGPAAAPVAGIHGAVIYVGDQSQDPNTGVDSALGYHSRNFGNIPFGFVYLDVVAKYGESWSTTLSHEVLELLEDPSASKVVTGPAPMNAAVSVYYDLEVCDPTQGDAYEIDGVMVSNFVGRAYFGQPGGSGKTNHLDLVLEPFGVRPKGYFQYEDGTHTYQVQGERVTQSALQARRSMGKGRRNARRAARVHLQGQPIEGGAPWTRATRIQQNNVDVTVGGSAGPSGGSVSGSVTIHFDRTPIVTAGPTRDDARAPRAETTNGHADAGALSGTLVLHLD